MSPFPPRISFLTALLLLAPLGCDGTPYGVDSLQGENTPGPRRPTTTDAATGRDASTGTGSDGGRAATTLDASMSSAAPDAAVPGLPLSADGGDSGSNFDAGPNLDAGADAGDAGTPIGSLEEEEQLALCVELYESAEVAEICKLQAAALGVTAVDNYTPPVGDAGLALNDDIVYNAACTTALALCPRTCTPEALAALNSPECNATVEEVDTCLTQVSEALDSVSLSCNDTAAFTRVQLAFLLLTNATVPESCTGIAPCIPLSIPGLVE